MGSNSFSVDLLFFLELYFGGFGGGAFLSSSPLLRASSISVNSFPPAAAALARGMRCAEICVKPEKAI